MSSECRIGVTGGIPSMQLTVVPDATQTRNVDTQFVLSAPNAQQSQGTVRLQFTLDIPGRGASDNFQVAFQTTASVDRFGRIAPREAAFTLPPCQDAGGCQTTVRLCQWCSGRAWRVPSSSRWTRPRQALAVGRRLSKR